MTDQPETELEYHFRKLSRKMVGGVAMLTAALFLLAAVLTMDSDPLMAFAFVLGVAALEILALAANSDGWARRLLNLIPGDNMEELQRPSEAATEVPADD